MEPNICILEKNYENIYLSVSYFIFKVDGSKKIKVMFLSDTTQRWVCLNAIVVNMI